MDLTCPTCETPLQATATDRLTVIVCSKCSHVVRIPHDGGAHTLTITATAPAPTPPPASLEATAEYVEDETYPRADERPFRPAARRDSLPPGTRFGDYEIIQEIAHGGMGVVYKARQLKLNRVVALKMILRGQVATEDQVRRFYAEAQSAAHLDHPGVVPVYEVGEHQGRHFYSMGFVEGTSLTARLADGPLPPREAAEIMFKVAQAVQYAHDRGVIHRDLKPSNILLQESGVRDQESEDRRDSGIALTPDSCVLTPVPIPPTPRITDFGLAKRVEADSELTRAGGVLGTPSYMPPEQAAGRSDEIGPLADVYSLGATLYCLLTARPPFQAAHVAETLRQVIEQEPVSPRQLNAAVDRDLETICLKCLQKEPSRRYASAADLADDLERYLEGRPIVARPISRAARLLRWCRRNPRVAILAGGFVLALVAGTVVSTLFGIEASASAIRASDNAEFYREEKLRADGETERALLALGREREALQKFKASLGETEDSIDKFVETVRNHELLKDARFQPVLKDLLKEALAHYQRYIQEHQDDHDTPARAKLAKALFEVGWINDASGSKEGAIAAYQQALAMYERLAREDPTVTEYQNDLARSHHNIGVLYRATGKPAEALAEYEKALAIQERLARENPTVTLYQSDLGLSHKNIGILYRATGKPAEALAAYEKAITIQERLARENPTVTEYQSELGLSHNSIGLLYGATGKPAEALAVFEKALAIFDCLARENPTVTQYQNDLAGSHNNIGLLYLATRKSAEALAAYEKALAIGERLARENPTVSQYQSDLAGSYVNIGLLYRDTGKSAEALAAYQKALAIRERLARENPTVTEYHHNLAGSYVNLAALTRKDEPEAAAERLAKAIELLQGVLRREPRDATARLFLRNAHWVRAQLRDDLGQYAQAAADWEQALALDDGRLRYAIARGMSLSLARTGEHQRATATADKLAKDARDGETLVDLARVYALSTAAATRDKSLKPEEQTKLADAYAAMAIDLLQRAAKAGHFRDAQHVKDLETSPDFASLRTRDTFRSLLKSFPVQTREPLSAPRP